MAFARVYSAQTVGLTPGIVSVEADLSRGLHNFTIVGLPDKAVEESRDRVAAAIKNSGFASPKSKNQRVVISLAPADLKKEGPLFDLAVALSYLRASDELSFDAEKILFVGELALDGALRPVPGVLPLVSHAQKEGFRAVVVPEGNAKEAALIAGIDVFGAASLTSVAQHLSGERALPPQPVTTVIYDPPTYAIDFDDIRGQQDSKRALAIAAAGGHNIALYGPPGTGKTLLARAFASILPPLSFDEVLETTGIHSVAGATRGALITHAPLRSPHHTASHTAMVGGGSIPRPGEITLAHRGVLFLDEFPEFDRRVIDSLRQPLEDRVVSISRARGSMQFPADFILIVAMNPCPCGNQGSKKPCVCMPVALERYKRKISEPIVDRIDLWVEVGPIEIDELGAKKERRGEGAALMAAVADARRRQKERFSRAGLSMTKNAALSVRDIDNHIVIPESGKGILRDAARKLNLSPRSYHKMIKISRTIADLAGEEEVRDDHVLEALRYRRKTSL